MKTLNKYLVNILIAFLYLVSFFCNTSYAAKLPYSDEPYFKKDLDSKIDIIYGESFRPYSHLLKSSSSSLYKEYSNLFKLSPYRKNSLVFVSPKYQLSNAFVQIYPLPAVFLYSSPTNIIDKSSINNWIQDALAHEMSHLFQLSAQIKLSHLLSYITSPYLWFAYPNPYLINFVLEGNAVLHESIYGTGGRLFSGWARAVVFSQLKKGYNLKRAINLYDDALSGSEKYLHGGYFYSYLNRRHSLSDLNKIFTLNSKNIVFPIGTYFLNRIFKKTLHKDFFTLFEKYKNFYLPQALEQKSSGSPVLFKSGVTYNLNSDKKNIFFLISDTRTPPQLVVINKKTKKYKLKRVDMPSGKVFKLKNKYYSSGTGWIDTSYYEVALFADGYKHYKPSRSLFVMDILNDKLIYLDAKQMLDQFRLYVGEKFYDTINSTAIASRPSGDIYYFKQDKGIRTLYKNKKAVASFKGYYGFPVEADASGVYFIASTRYGSSLFCYKEGQIFRMSDSDTIVAARKMSKNKFLVSEIATSHYEYKIISTQEIPEKPYLYQYTFKKNNLLSKEMKTIKKSKGKDYVYNPIDNLRFEELQFTFGSVKIDPDFYNNLKFHFQLNYVDPLQRNTLSISSLLSDKQKKGSLRYQNTTNRLNWSLGYEYDKGILSLNISEEKIVININDLSVESLTALFARYLSKEQQPKYTNNEFKISFLYPIFKKEHLDLNFLSEGSVGFRKLSKDNAWQNYIYNKSVLQFLFRRKYSNAFSDYQNIESNLFYETLYIKSIKEPYLATGANLFAQQEIGSGLYISSEVSWIHNLLTNRKTQLFQENTRKGTSLSFHSFFLRQQVSDLKQFDFYLKKELHHSLYFLRFPLSLRRWAPLTGISFVDLRENSAPDTPNYALHTFLGGEFDITLNYEHPILIGFSGGLVWKWKHEFKRTKPRLHSGLYLKTTF